ncbi:MFS transporter [Herbiconiux ginsengi]|uniref:Na+/melibiose symporter n=1 Tax=Herbiconiux ginsengi TaxID=381665 RepID=A0A1H3TGR2_9MICO|nr:MFS transporter [Herbiconiux ginsengi]SDZ49492.1 Na+/melibiose symporter [Herbiconiux ginsengi]
MTTEVSTTTITAALPGVSGKYAPGSRLRRYMLTYSLANLGINLIWGGVLAILIPLHVQGIEFAQYFTGADASVNLQALTALQAQVTAGEVSPSSEQARLLGLLGDYEAAKANGLALVSSVGVLLTMLVQPVVGMLSDRTRSRLGRRAPFIVGGVVGGGILLIALSFAPSLALVVLLLSLLQLSVNIAQGPLTATVADRVPEERLATVSAVTGLVSYVGSIVGSVAAGTLFAALGLAAYYPFVVLLVLLPIIFVLASRDRSSKTLEVSPLRTRDLFKSYGYALRSRDFRWAWIAKVVLFIGVGVSSVYSIYMLQAYVQPTLSASEAAQTAPLLGLVALPGTLVGMAVVGRWSDRSGRRKPFVIVASLIMAVSFLVPFFWPSVTALFVQSAIMGVGLGAFLVVDQALFIDVLPDPNSAGRDLGMAALGQNLGSALGPLLAGTVVALSSGFYGYVWPVAFVVALLAAVAIIPIKGVR